MNTQLLNKAVFDEKGNLSFLVDDYTTLNWHSKYTFTENTHMECPQCGTNVTEHKDIFCRTCGIRLNYSQTKEKTKYKEAYAIREAYWYCENNNIPFSKIDAILEKGVNYSSPK